MNHVREKVSPRFEGVQYTVSENPLIILNQVDFLYVKVYYLDPIRRWAMAREITIFGKQT